MAKKQVIKLTENDLHRIIKESVNNVLTELDWKTYANAAERRRHQNKLNKSDALAVQATKAFKDKYLDGSNYLRDDNPNDNRNFAVGKVNVHPSYGNITDTRYDGINKSKLEFAYSKHHKNPAWGNTGEPTPNMAKRSDEYINKLNAMHQDMKNYYGGKSKYIKGQGWQ